MEICLASTCFNNHQKNIVQHKRTSVKRAPSSARTAYIVRCTIHVCEVRYDHLLALPLLIVQCYSTVFILYSMGNYGYLHFNTTARPYRLRVPGECNVNTICRWHSARQVSLEVSPEGMMSLGLRYICSSPISKYYSSISFVNILTEYRRMRVKGTGNYKQYLSSSGNIIKLVTQN